MQIPRPSPKPSASVKVACRRPSATALQVLESAASAERTAASLESQSLFQEMVDRGIVRKARMHGHIPPERYALWAGIRLVAFMQAYDLDDQPLWRKALAESVAEDQIPQLAEQLGIPIPELEKILRLVRAADTRLGSLPLHEDRTAGPAGGAVLEDTITREGVHVLIRFCQQYGVTEEDFTDNIINATLSRRQLAERFGAPLAEIDTVMDAISGSLYVDLLSDGEDNTPYTRVTATQTHRPHRLAAEACVGENGQLELRFLSQHDGFRYLLNQRLLDDWSSSIRDRDQLETLLEQMRALNERSDDVCAVIRNLCLEQLDFVQTGYARDLRPLSQSDLARRVCCNRSRVSRLVRDLQIVTSHGCYTLVELLPRRREVIERLIELHPAWSDTQISSYLSAKYGVALSRRAVNYHRVRLRSGRHAVEVTCLKKPPSEPERE